MNWKVPVGFLFAGILISLVFSIDKMNWITYADVSPIVTVMTFKGGPMLWLQSFYHVVMFDYACFNGTWILARWILFGVVGGGLLVTLVLNIVMSVGGSIGNAFRLIGRK